MAYEIIDAQQDLYRLYVEFKRDVVERSTLCLSHAMFTLARYAARAVMTLPSPSPTTPQMQTTRDHSVPMVLRDSKCYTTFTNHFHPLTGSQP